MQLRLKLVNNQPNCFGTNYKMQKHAHSTKPFLVLSFETEKRPALLERTLVHSL